MSIFILSQWGWGEGLELEEMAGVEAGCREKASTHTHTLTGALGGARGAKS